MKKLCKFLVLCMMVLLIPHNNAFVQAQTSYDIINISDQNYEIILKATNKNGSTIICVGTPLKDINVTSVSKYKNEYVSGNIQWVNPEYKIIIGDQTVNATFYCNKTQETVNLNIYIYGIPDPYYNMEKDKTEKKELLNGGKNVKEVLPIGVIGCSIESILDPTDMIFYDKNNNIILGDLVYTNFDNSKNGLQEVTWTFTPNNDIYETKVGYIEVKLEEDIEIESTSLTATTLLLSTTDSTFDINLDNKVKDSTYLWKSSNTKVARVATNGLVSAVNEGEATVSCTITNGYDVQVLEADVIVGGDNATQLTDTELELEVGDLYNVDVENGISGAKYRWTTSDKSVAKTTTTSGKITGLKSGTATITCTITKDKEIIILKCNVNVE